MTVKKRARALSKDLEITKELLERFVLNNPDLELLEKEISGFNIFQAIGMGSQEIRHSKTIAYLLDPSEQHGLGQYFLKRVLMRLVDGSDNISPIDIDCGNFLDVEIRREWQHIDILIICPSVKIVVAIENKIHAQEHSDQLKRYSTRIEKEKQFKDYEKLFVFLTKSGEDPDNTADRKIWTPASHTDIVADLEYSAAQRASDIGPDQKVLIHHYIDLMKRYVLEGSEVAKLAGNIYTDHKKAIDILFENQPRDEREKIAIFVKGLAENNKLFNLGVCKGSTVRFWPKRWSFDGIKAPISGNFKGTPIVFEADVRGNFDFNIELVLGNLSKKDKTRLCNTVKENLEAPEPIRTFASHPRAWDKKLIQLDSSDDGGESNETDLNEYWEDFLKEEPKISAVVAQVLDEFK